MTSFNVQDSTFSPHTVFMCFYLSHNKHRLFPHTQQWLTCFQTEKCLLRGTGWILHTVQFKSDPVQLMMLYTQIDTVELRTTILIWSEYHVVSRAINITPNIAPAIFFLTGY